MVFDSFFMAGFECSSHRLREGTRLDLTHSTQHDTLAERDYRRVRNFNMRTVRDGIRWHLIETKPYHYNFSSVLPMIHAAQRAGVQVIWDIFHYGWPDDLDIFSTDFVTRFGRLARAFASLLRDETGDTVFVAPVNEPSFVSWGGGDAGFLNPFATGRDSEIKAQLIRAIIAASEAVWDVCPNARIVQCEPAIHIVADPKQPQDRDAAENYRLSQFQAIDMLVGRVAPELGGNPKYLDLLGMNFYYNNEWIHNGTPLYTFHPLYRPFHKIIVEFYERYGRPLFVAETGVEDNSRPGWLAYVCAEVRWAMSLGIPMEGICLYPILNHPGWLDERHCHNGLFEYADELGDREVFEPLARELKLQQLAFANMDQKQVAAHVESEPEFKS
jgi:beta-glucosidase/6-phospho-beta-glucosidase/beta-galactosidase